LNALQIVFHPKVAGATVAAMLLASTALPHKPGLQALRNSVPLVVGGLFAGQSKKAA